MRRPIWRPILIFALGLAVTPAWGDRIELQNGDVISGTIRSMTPDTVVIETDYGVLEVDRSAVARGEFGRPDSYRDSSLLFYFPLDGSLDDPVGDYRATNNGMRFVADSAGLPEAAMRSDGTGTYLSIASSGELDTLDQFTVSFWIRLEDLSGTQYLMSKWTRADGENADGKFTVQSSGGNITLFVVDQDGVYHWLRARNVLTARTWHSVAFTFAAGRAAIYVDGVQAALQRFEFNDLFHDTSPVLVMTALAQAEDPYAYYNTVGSVDEIRFYDRALAPEEIAVLSAKVSAQ